MEVEEWLGNSSLSSRNSGFRDLSLRGPCLSQAFRNTSLHDRHTQLFTILLYGPLYGPRQKHHSSPATMCRVRRPTSVHTATRGMQVQQQRICNMAIGQCDGIPADNADGWAAPNCRPWRFSRDGMGSGRP